MDPVGYSVVSLVSERPACPPCCVAEHCLSAGLDVGVWAALRDESEARRNLRPGQSLFRRNTPAHVLFYVAVGSFVTYRTDPDGGNHVIGFHLPGDLLGTAALLDGMHDCDAEALEYARVCAVPTDRLARLADAQAGTLLRRLVLLLNRKAMLQQRQVLMMGKRQAEARLAMFLLDWSERCRRLDRNPARLQLPMSRCDLGSYLGLALETVSRMFGRLQEAGIIRVQRKTVLIIDEAALSAVGQETTRLAHPTAQAGDCQARRDWRPSFC